VARAHRSPIEVAKPTAKFDLTVYLSETADGLSATWQYNTDVFDEPRIARMTGHFRTMLDAIAEAPESALSDLPLLTAAERHQLVTTWNQTAVPAGDERCFHQVFEEQAQARPGALAVLHNTAPLERNGASLATFGNERTGGVGKPARDDARRRGAPLHGIALSIGAAPAAARA